MSWRNILTVYFKELRDMVRDRRTMISLILVPTLIMPAIILGAGYASIRVVKKVSSTTPSVMLLGGADSPKVRTALETNDKIKLVSPAEDWREMISDKKLGAVVRIPDGFDSALERMELLELRIYHYEGEIRSGFALSELKRFFTEYKDKIIAGRLTERGLPPDVIRPFKIASENVAAPEKVGGNTFGGIIPYLFIIMCFVGAMYPAMDLTAGEKERGTMETILCSPVSRVDLALGKFLTVLTGSLATVLCSLLSMLACFLIGSSLLLKSGVVPSGAAAPTLPSLDPLGMLAVLAMVLPMSILFSALLFAVALFAKSFKEAQSYLSPMILLIILPVIGGILPGVELDARLAMVPILNISLVSKELVSGVWNWQYIAIIFGSTCVYAAAALAFAVKMFNREDVLFRA